MKRITNTNLLRPLGLFMGFVLVTLGVVSCSGGETRDSSSAPLGSVETTGLEITNVGLIDTPNHPARKLQIGPMIDRLAPNFRLENSGGGVVTLSNLRGTPVFLNFWATWCGPCRSEMPIMEDMHEKLGARLAVVAIDVGESVEKVNNYKTELGLTFPTVIDHDEEVLNGYAPFGLPTTYLIDRDGVVRFVKVGPFVDEDDINRGLAKVGLAL